MADSPLNNSWPSFSKLWMKRWSFKRASECKPCVQPCGSPGAHLTVQPFAAGGAGSSSSLPPASIAEDSFFNSSPDDEETSSVVSDYDCPCAELSNGGDFLPGLGPLADPEYFTDLEEACKPPAQSQSPPAGPEATPDPQQAADHPAHRYVVTQLSPRPAAACVPDRGERSDPSGALDLTIDLNGLLETMETITGSEEDMERSGVDVHAEVDTDSFPILVRSMSTSRRHSWGVPVSPLNLGRRLSLDTAAMDSDGEREDDDEDERPSAVFQPTQTQQQQQQRPGDEADGSRGPWSRGTRTPADGGRHLYSEMLAADDGSRAAHVSRVLQTSKQAARATGAEVGPEESLHSSEGQSHMLMVQKVLQELRLYHGAKQRNSRADAKESGSVTWYEFLSNENEDEAERTEKVEKGTKVRRTLSSLRNRMTGSFNKDKGKNGQKGRRRGREAGGGGGGGGSSHRLVPGSFSSCASCSLCSKTLQTKHGLQCMNCAVNVHKSCKSLLGECTSSKKRDFPARSGSSPSPAVALWNQEREHEHADPASSQALDGHPGFLGSPGMTIGHRGSTTHPHACGSSTALPPPVGHALCHHSSSGSLPGEMDEPDALRSRRCPDDTVSLAPSTTESIIVEDSQFAALRADLESDAQDLEAESWSLAVDQEHVKKLCKETVKRQDVIYELMQTEMHHVRTLKIMLHVYARELKENLQMDPGRLECLFPRLENLLELHAHFLSRLKERQRDSLSSPSDRNYTIYRVADILIEQFSGEVGEKMRDCYGDFCSRHTEAVSYYKEQKQSNKKFHNVIRKINNLPIVRRLGVTECILLVTQRITKYPVLVERLLHNTEAGTDEHVDLTRSLSLIKETIVRVDAQVNVHEKNSRLRDIHSKMEPKALGKFKDGRVFRREDLAQGRRRLLHEGTVSWKAASGRLKDILAVLLSDVLLLLQEKDQRYVFASVDNKPSVISLQKLIVREVAQEEKAMFLICASSNEPEMYKIHTTSKEERNAWMAHIRQAAESCPHTEERLVSEEEEARNYRFKEFQEHLSQKDAVITRALSEKLQLFAELAESVIGPEEAASRSRLLLRGDTPDLQQGEALLKGAITEVENLQNLLQSRVKEEDAAPRQEDGSGSGHLPRRAVTFGGYDSSPAILNGSVKKNFSGESRNRDRSQRASSDPQLKELCGSHTLEQTVDESSCSPARWSRAPSSFPEAEFFDSVLMLSQKLYSLQAVISQWDSHWELELQRASLSGRYKGNGLLEQEKQRTLALQREELATFHKMQSQHRQEQQRWERERERHRLQAEATEARLHQREEECRRLEEQLAEERKELESQRETYQQDLERLRESTRAVEKEKERLEHQKKLKRKTIEVAPMSGSLNGELLASSALASVTSDLPPRPLVRSSLSVAPADYPERPEVILRREASSSTLSLKTEVPLHLFSTTNQLHKPVGVQQQIPTKLAAFSSGKGKAGKSSRAPHRSDSSAASVDMRQMLPMKLSAPGDGSLKARHSVSPNQQLSLSVTLPPHCLHPHTEFSAAEMAAVDVQASSGASHPPSLHKPPVPPPQPHPLPSSKSPPPSQSGGSLLYSTQMGMQGPGPSPPAHGHGPPPPYKINPEELSKEDVIFF